MPDLTVVTMQMCSDLDRRVVQVKNYSIVLDPVHGFSCTCPSFRFSRWPNKTCKHVNLVESESCTWHQQWDIAQTPEQEANQICPKCGKKTVYVQVGV